MTIEVMRLGSDDLTLCRDLMTLFGGAFAEPDTYTGARPPDAYHADLLSRHGIIVLVARTDADPAGGLVAYELPKLENGVRKSTSTISPWWPATAAVGSPLP